VSTTPPAPFPPSKPSPLLHLGHPEGEHIPFFELPREASKVVPHKHIVGFAIVGVAIAFLGQWFEHLGEHAQTPDVALPWVLPFGLLLACIATMPFIAKHFWEKHYHHVAMALAAIVAVYYIFVLQSPPPEHGQGGGFFGSRAGGSMAGSFGEYISFIFLLGSLFTISGGIVISVRRKATPAVNTALLLTGAIIANIFGTTGAAMLLIRPFLRINKGHLRTFHIIFFIFVVANCGGSLTPIGDPPLFLGYLKGVPFWWVLEHCWPMWCVAVGVLLAVFFAFDVRAFQKEERAAHDADDLGPAVSIFGVSNLLLIFGVLAGVLLHDKLVEAVHLPWRELIMVAAVSLSLWTTPHRLHEENVFNFAPIREVALLFVGIFATMVPALNYLSTHANDEAFKSALHTPGQFYYSSGALSSVLDNAPTYVTFLQTEIGKLPRKEIEFVTQVVKDPNKDHPDAADFARFFDANAADYPTPAARDEAQAAIDRIFIEGLIKYHKEKVRTGQLSNDQIQVSFLLGDEKLNWYIIAVSLGSVFFGAMTYIGNGPNFMVKSIAENAGAKCPSFFGYIFVYSLPILLPILVLVWAIFLRPHAG
jgi:Na+/H+ antiporter NhaD/arsenite permease-like protein